MAKKFNQSIYTPVPKTRRRNKKRGLNLRKKHGPRHHMRVNR